MTKAGRPKGALNKVTRSMKETVSATLEWLQTQPRVNMRDWAKENPTEFYRIASKLMPTEITAEIKQTHTGIFRVGGQEIPFETKG